MRHKTFNILFIILTFLLTILDFGLAIITPVLGYKLLDIIFGVIMLIFTIMNIYYYLESREGYYW